MTAADNIIEIKAYSIKELSDIYGICDKTFKKWINPFYKDIGDRQGRYYNVAQVKVIFCKLGFPCKMVQKTLFD